MKKKKFFCEPSSNRSQYLEHVKQVLDKNGDVMQVACGDFNTDLLNEHTAARTTLETLMTGQGLDLVGLPGPTRETVTSRTSIDFIYSIIPVQLSQIKNNFSDHYSLLKLSMKWQKTSLNIDP